MDFVEIIKQARALLQSEGRITYRTLKRQFALDDEALDDLKFELIEGQEVAADKDGKMLVWTGEEAQDGIDETAETSSQPADAPVLEPPSSAPSSQSAPETLAGERRQLTVMFCDLVGSTALSEQLDPEELQTVVRTYQEVSAQVIERYEGHIAQYLGDGLLVYFGYPAAHEDDAARAIRVGLEIVSALDQARSQFPQPVQVRIGIHTGPVVVGQMGGGSRHEQLALGETPNIAARVQGQAEPGEVIISAATQRLVTGLFETEDRGRHELKGISFPISLSRVTGEGIARSRFEVVARRGLTPLVGRDLEAGFLAERWEQAKTGAGQAVLLSGEPGIGKSRLTSELRAQIEHHDQAAAIPIVFRCSPYSQNSAFYPIIDRLSQVLQFRPGDAPEHKVAKLCEALRPYRFPQAETQALFARLLSLPAPEDSPPLTLSPQRQKQKTQEALVAWFLEEAEQQAVYAIWEDLHWADSSTLEVLSLFLDQLPTARILAVLTYRPEFSPPWPVRSHMTQFTLGRLGHSQMEAIVTRVTGGKPLPPALMAEVASKTDGIPLFVEEFTKMVVESDWLHETDGHYELAGPLPTLSIPSTLQDSLMARLDRLATAKAVAQLGATIGREFSYALIAAIAPLDEATLHEGLRQLVEAELVYQRGLPPDAHYQFKHALIQDTAYQSLLKRTRQEYHQQIAQVLEQQFAEVVETQPELLAQHYTEAGLTEQAIVYWQQAGQRASDRSAYQEAMSHVTTGLHLLQTLPETLARQQQELPLQLALGTATLTVRGYAALEVEAAYTRARVLCQHLGDTQDVSPVLYGLWQFYLARADFPLARQLGEELLGLAEHRDEPPLSVTARYTLGATSYHLGELLAARSHSEEGIACYTPAQRSSPLFRAGVDPGVGCPLYAAMTLWSLGYPDQALVHVQDWLALAAELAHPFSSAYALIFAAFLDQLRREEQGASDHAEAAVTLSTEQGFAQWLAWGTIMQGWALTTQGQGEEGLRQMRHGLTAWRATGAELGVPYLLSLLAEGYARLGQGEAGLAVLQEGWEVMERTGEHSWHAEMSRLKGVLLLQQQGTVQAEAEACFQQAIAVAQQQSAKSWELRAATSLARLWQQQGQTAEAHDLLAPVYSWFTEGFDTADLKDAKTLLDELKRKDCQ